MDDTSRGVRNEEMRSRVDETTRNYAETPGAAPNRPAAMTPGMTRPSTIPAGTSDSDSDPDTNRRTRQIRAEIEQTREDMSETIDAIQEKLRPANVAAEAREKVKTATVEGVKQMTDRARETAQGALEGTREMAVNLAEGARNNAIPAAMIGIGVAWFIADRVRDASRRNRWRDRSSGRSDSSYTPAGYYENDEYSRSGRGAYRGSDSDAPEYGGGRSELLGRVSSTVGDTREAAMRTGRRAKNAFQRLLERNPLMIGAASLAVGAAVGLALPETERENEWMGEARDTVVDKAQDMAKSAATQAREAAGDLAGQVTSQVVKGEG